ncbi:hypothetical protein OHB53_08975 [Streptomyces sp. NBC_00056]|uniref:hypothetical protein n=1 Tax=unclassified Streptomyces TaxID=2593676 RepID=UPI002257D2E1|nr:hypothetical protein [Streptomyces sp. NBC_00063]MCX5441280.1 hypothetical protein [Streptomyces sp. NBC_00063]
MRIIMQPASRAKKVVNQHYLDTIANPVVIENYAHLLDAQVVDQLGALFPDGSAPMWGVAPGKGNVNVSKIKKMRAGDWVVFTGENKLYLGGTIALTWRSKDMAQQLWDSGDDGSTWEFMYAISGIQGFDIPIQEVRKLLNWTENRNVMNVTILGEDDSDTLQSLLTLDPAPAVLAPVDEQEEEAAIASFDGDLERQSQRAHRGEQAALKRRLLPGNSGECALCGRRLPGAFLIGAHIKKRAMCDDGEKRDLANIAMLACTFGCDALYEHGYIAVGPHGEIQVSPLAKDLPAVAQHIENWLATRQVTWWNEDREKYYQWHRTHTFKNSPPA